MNIIIDTNVLIAMLIKQGIVRKIIVNHPGAFITPEWCFTELWEHRKVWNRRNLDDSELQDILEDLKKYYIFTVSSDYYIAFEKEASELINDPDDIPLIALALAVENIGIWTFNTGDFLTEKIQKRVKILSTRDVVELYPIVEDDIY